MTPRLPLVFATLLTALSCTQTAGTPALQNTDLAKTLILGDSQISFGAGGPYTKFFSAIAKHCADTPAKFQKTHAAAIGVRSTALHHWTSRSDRAPICEVDKRWGVNAGTYGVTTPDRTFVQIGKTPGYPYCTAGRTSLDAVLDSIEPDLLVFSFLGNAIDRWQSPGTARADWAITAAMIPDELPCIVMTTIPSYDAATNTKRQSAQDNLERAVTASNRCAFVPGLTARTIATFEGNKRHFSTNEAGEVTDPGHPSEASAARFVKLQTPALCAALARVLPD